MSARHLPSRWDRTFGRGARWWRIQWLPHEAESERRRLVDNIALEIGDRALSWAQP